MLKEVRKLMDLPSPTGENVSVINILQNWTRFLRSWHEKIDKFLKLTQKLQNACKLSVKVVRVTICVYITPKGVKQYKLIFLYCLLYNALLIVQKSKKVVRGNPELRGW